MFRAVRGNISIYFILLYRGIRVYGISDHEADLRRRLIFYEDSNPLYKYLVCTRVCMYVWSRI